MLRVLLVIVLAAVLAVSLGWLYVAVTTPGEVAPVAAGAAEPAARAESTRRIHANLFYVADDGTHLALVEREISYAAAPADQARQLLEAQLAPAPDGLTSAVPDGVTLRALFLSDDGQAFVDLAGDALRAHGGGSLDELLAVYAIVNVLTVNLPSITAVQILVDGQEVDTLAGHVDLRHPLRKNLTLVQSHQNPS